MEKKKKKKCKIFKLKYLGLALGVVAYYFWQRNPTSREEFESEMEADESNPEEGGFDDYY